MLNNVPNNQNPVDFSVEEIATPRSEITRDVSRIAVRSLLSAGVATALTYGICFGAIKGDTSQCEAPVVMTAISSSVFLLIAGSLNYYIKNFRHDRENPISRASLVVSTSPPLEVMPVPSAPELNSASGAPSLRSSLHRENLNRSTVTADLVFPGNQVIR
jgi:hypothetical protein